MHFRPFSSIEERSIPRSVFSFPSFPVLGGMTYSTFLRLVFAMAVWCIAYAAVAVLMFHLQQGINVSEYITTSETFGLKIG
ncbi:hypothetical protein OPV22_007147 [Ensete ventricosum]|uniref:Amino acid transporter transmembrane domain-containing protein n=1 Tax=Ensete ventricosum TaxID=4639 RepID=A0AAV8Q7R3_ENSVE|nr:hypothetical protein OPV22_007147 [Ensete ventricosum]